MLCKGVRFCTTTSNSRPEALRAGIRVRVVRRVQMRDLVDQQACMLQQEMWQNLRGFRLATGKFALALS